MFINGEISVYQQQQGVLCITVKKDVENNKKDNCMIHTHLEIGIAPFKAAELNKNVQ